MPQIIDIPGVGHVEFPDGMSDTDIVSAIKTMRPQAPAQDGAQALATETGVGKSILVGAGRKTDAILDGLTQMYLKARGEDSALGGLAQNVAEKEAIYAPLKQAHPIATSVGEAVPAMAGGSTMMGAAAAGAIPELLAYGSLGDKAKNAALSATGNVIGTGIGKAVGRALKPAGAGRAVLSPEATAAAERVGYKMTAGEISQNPAMQGVENYLARSPGSSGAMQARSLANRAALNRAAAGAMGQKADDLSEGVFSTARDAIGQEFERLQQATAPQLGNDFLNAVAEVDSANVARGAFRNARIDKLIDQSLDLAAKGNLSGTAYKEIRSELSSEASKAFKAGDATLGQAYKAVRKALDDAAEQSLGQADREAWKTTRQQWQAYKLLTKGNVTEGGNVSAARLAGAVRSQGDALRTGAAKGPLADVARIGESVKGVPNPTSGQLMQQMVYGNPVTGIPAVIGNKVAESIYMSPLVQRYMARGLLDVGPNGQLLLGTAGKPAGAALLKQYLGAE